MIIEQIVLIRVIIKALKFPIKLILLLVPPKLRLFTSSPDTFVRYKQVLLELEKVLNDLNLKNPKILDVGGGNGLFTKLFGDKFDITTIDTISNSSNQYKTILGDGNCMPFKDNSFDISISIATFQYITKKRRDKFINELKRVARYNIILYSPINTSFGIEKKLHNIRRKIGLEDRWLEDELKIGLPTIGQIKKTLPDVNYYGVQNQRVWYYVMLISSIPLFNLIFPGFVYSLLKPLDTRPPYLAYIFTWKLKKRSKLQKK